MIKRLYVNNFRALVNFELQLDSLGLLMGPNGSGKSSAFEALRLVRDFVTGEATTLDLFSASSLTRWQSTPIQTFEIAIASAGGDYLYHLEIEHENLRDRSRALRQRLTFNGQPLYESELDHAQLYRDDHSQGPAVLSDWTRCGLASIQPRHDNTRLTWFKDRVRKILVIRLDPIGMKARSEADEELLRPDASNFVSWFRHFAQMNLGLMADLVSQLREALPGFDTLSLSPDGREAKVLKIRFRAPSSNGTPSHAYECRFDELSEGQKVLIALYAILLGASAESGYSLCLDEPENFVALREIQPWLNMLIEQTELQTCQGILISHHPELINLLASSSGQWLERSAGGPVRVLPVTDNDTGLSVSELIARGWLHG